MHVKHQACKVMREPCHQAMSGQATKICVAKPCMKPCMVKSDVFKPQSYTWSNY